MGQSRIDAVVPLAAADFERFHKLLLPSLQCFFGVLGTCWVVAPATDVEFLKDGIDDERFQVLSEVDLIPELPLYRKILRRVGIATGAGRGWFVQQIIKLAIAKRVTTPFYLTLDADVLCVKEVKYDDLVRDGRGIAVVYHSDKDIHGGWYWWTEKVLGFPRSGRTHGVTPALLSAEAVARLSEFLQSRVKDKGLSCEAYLLKNLPWTEYTLYYTFLEHMGLFAHYHFEAASALYGNSVWHAGDLPSWRADASFGPDSDYFFSVIQNDAAPSVDDIVALVSPYLATGRRVNRRKQGIH
jgi:hypothetical protein